MALSLLQRHKHRLPHGVLIASVNVNESVAAGMEVMSISAPELAAQFMSEIPVYFLTKI
jgi:hypothetical protein